MAKRSEVSVADRREAVLCLLRREEPAAAIARRVGVSEPTLYRWRDEFWRRVKRRDDDEDTHDSIDLAAE